MRVISGHYRGKKILQPEDKETRPLKDLTKESIFNIINHSNKFKIDINESHVLDLFSGTGSFGIECLSRNAKSVIFIENYNRALNILKKNTDSLKLNNNFQIIEKNIFEDLNFQSFKKKFDLIFLDPPYKEKRINLILLKIYEAKVLNINGIIIVHKHKKDDTILLEKFNIIEEKIYGISKIIFGNYP